MQERIITLATPVFFALIALELLVAWRLGRRVYRVNDALTSIGLGILSQVWGVYTRIFRIGIYALLFDHVALAHWPADAWWTIPAAIVFYDFCYYWHHRGMHRIAVMWGAHVVHHSSEDYNLSTALRQTGSGFVLGWIPYVPMALAGVPPVAFAIAALVDLLYQYWIHTELVGRLGAFDRVFASPSNHRVHHGVNDRYVDRNYGGILIVWDRIFGTFAEERDDDPVVYGTRVPLRSFNPLWANAEVYARLLRESAATRRWRDRVQLWLRPPGWHPPDTASRPAVPFALPARTARWDPPLAAPLRVYVLVQFALVLVVTVQFLEAHTRAPLAESIACTAWLSASLLAIGWLLEGRRIGPWLEIARLAAAAAVVIGAGRWLGGLQVPVAAQWAVGAAAFASAAVLWRIGRDAGARPSRVPADA